MIESIAATLLAITFMLMGDRADNKVGEVAFYVLACLFVVLALIGYTSEFHGWGS
jgi:hypothetical protein